jgi:hypothetical protein
VSDIASRIAAAAGDAERLLVIAIELANENANLAGHAAALEHAEVVRKDAQAERKRRQRHGQSRDVTGQSVTSQDVPATVPPSPSSSFPEPHITPSSPPSAATSAAAADELDAVAALLARIPDAARPAWAATIRVAEEGMHGPALTRTQIDTACRDYLGNGNLAKASPSMRHFRAYLADVARPEAEKSTPRSGEQDAERAWQEVLAMIPAWQRREVTAETHAALPVRTRRGLSAIGGFLAIQGTASDRIVWLKKEFVAAYRSGAPAQPAARASP